MIEIFRTLSQSDELPFETVIQNVIIHIPDVKNHSVYQRVSFFFIHFTYTNFSLSLPLMVSISLCKVYHKTKQSAILRLAMGWNIRTL